MGLFLSRISEILESFREEPIKIAILGLDDAGKTTVLYKIKKFNEAVTTIPITTLNVETVSLSKGLTLTIWDISGQTGIRPLWKLNFRNIAGLIYVVGSSNPKRFQESKEELFVMLDSIEITAVPVLILANKQDLPLSEPVMKIMEHLGLKDTKNKWHIQGCCAVNGDGLLERMLEFSRMLKENMKK